MLGYEVVTAGRAMSRTRSADDVGEPRQQRSNHSKEDFDMFSPESVKVDMCTSDYDTLSTLN